MRGTALTIGNFDGVHAAHREILARVRRIARARGLDTAAVTFHPHPTKVVAPDRAPALMTTPEERAELMQRDGIDRVVILPFTEELARLSPEEFVRTVLVEQLQARAVVVGDNFRFGHKQAGDIHTLADLGRQYGFTVDIVGAVCLRGAIVSSSAIRQAVREGKVSAAYRMLDRPFSLRGEVVSGQGIGRRQTVPTLNLKPGTDLLPKNGVYITRTTDLANRRKWESITNVGTRPTFDGDQLTIETFILSPYQAPDPERIQVDFLWHLRDEKKFDSPEALKNQIMRDVARAKTYFRRERQSIQCPAPRR